MMIIAQKNNLKTYMDYLNSVFSNNYIDGLIIPVIMTKDKQIVVFDEQVSKRSNTEILQNSTVEQIKSESIFLLSIFLERIKNTSKRIIINVYPLYITIISDETIQYVNQLYTEYINTINDIIKNYPQLNISLCSINNQLLQIIKRNTPKNIKKGLIIVQENLNYVDVNFYVISPIMLDTIILKEELDKGKEIMLTAISSDDFSVIKDFFETKPNQIKQEILNKITFITPYPDILNEIL